MNGVIAKQAIPKAIANMATPAQNLSQGEDVIVIARPSLGWSFICSLLDWFTSSPLVVQGVETRKPRTVGSSRGFRVLVIKNPLKAGSMF